MSVLSRVGVPVFVAGGRPVIDEETFRLEVAGLAAKDLSLSISEIKALPGACESSRLLSVSGWSVRAVWEGVRWADFLKVAQASPKAIHAAFASAGGDYTTTIALADLNTPRVMLVYGVEGEDLEPDYGGPLRLVAPHLYGYKSAKWLARIDFTDRMRGGYWEDKGYTRSGVIEPGLTLDLNTKSRRPIEGGEVLDF